MALDPKVFKAYDVRGLYPDELDEEGATRIGRAYAEHFELERSPSGATRGSPLPTMAEAVIGGALDAGADVVDIGLVGTEMLYFAVGELGLDGGIMVTASHNPKEYTGLKIVRAGALPVGGDSGLLDIRDRATSAPRATGRAAWKLAARGRLSGLHRPRALVHRARGDPAAPGRVRRCERHGRRRCCHRSSNGSRRRRSLFLRAGRQLPESRAEPAPAREPRVHRPEGARRTRRPRHRLRRRRRSLLLRRRRGRVRPRRLRHGAPRGGDAREGAGRDRHLRRARELGGARTSSRPPAERRS